MHFAPAIEKSVLGLWSFNYLYPIDESGNGINLHPMANTGPDVSGGLGSSLFLSDAESMVNSISSNVVTGPEFSVLLDVFSIGTGLTQQLASIVTLGSQLVVGTQSQGKSGTWKLRVFAGNAVSKSCSDASSRPSTVESIGKQRCKCGN
eukprot:Gregarina_sp_Poly_1__8050@NODE_4628_length_540_cov_3_765328_g1434_i1_p1_GENE_NODE_4628_length_540_cov_3_765328_g1434_i1NODE_4628_length_540_cov_3_765328_g1434_i1_p1_ORF_typecomplete_len149_score6_07DUF1860/PF08949_10/0_0069_NODE_4628_length_540_cov_3_765328_g1434_i194540